MISGLALCRGAAIEIGHLDPIETLSDGDADFILGTLNRLIDNWNADREAVYADVFTTYGLTPALSPHTIGPTGSLVTPARPVTIDGATLISGTSRTPIALQPAGWWRGLASPTLTGAIPNQAYYDPTWPNGTLYLYPVPSAVASIELMTRQVLTAIALATIVSLPQGYESALLLTVAEQIAAPLGIGVPPKTEKAATDARARIFTNNRAPTPRLATRDAGMPGGGRGTGYDYRTGPR